MRKKGRVIIVLLMLIFIMLAGCGTAKEDTYQPGTRTEMGFESKWLNLRFEAPEDVIMSTQEELDVIRNSGFEFMYEDNAENMVAYAEKNLVYEMAATHVSGVNILVEVEKISKLQSQITTEEYLRMVVDSMLETSLDYEDKDIVYITDFAGEEYIGKDVAVTYATGYEVNQEILVRKKQNRMIVVILSYATGMEEEADYMLSLFQEYDPERPLPTAGPKPEDTYEKGVLTESGFESEWIGLRFEKPENVSMATQEEMDDEMFQSLEDIYESGAEMALDYAKLSTVNEMRATWEIGLPVVQILVEKVSYRAMTEEDYLIQLKKNIELLYGNSMDLGYGEDFDTIVIGGLEFEVFSMWLEQDGVKIKQEYCVRKKEGRMMCIIFTYVEMEGMDVYLKEAMESFKAY